MQQDDENLGETDASPKTPNRPPQENLPVLLSSPGTGQRSLLSNSSLATYTSTPMTEMRVSTLKSIIGDSNFEARLKEKTQRKKEYDERILFDLQTSMSDMDKALTQEIKRRIEMQKDIELKTNDSIKELEMTLKGILEERMALYNERLDTLEVKVQELNQRLSEESDRLPKDLEALGQELKALLGTFQNEFNIEKHDRLTREGRIMKQLNDHAQDIKKRWNTESFERDSAINDLSDRVVNMETSRQDFQDELEKTILGEIEGIKAALHKESAERKMEDDEIVAALNRYTENLQNSLALLE